LLTAIIISLPLAWRAQLDRVGADQPAKVIPIRSDLFFDTLEFPMLAAATR
jgi:hypothetical protein